MLGALFGTSSSVLCPGEYFAFYATTVILPSALSRIPSTLREPYLADVRTHAAIFAKRAAEGVGAAIFCDATPWNLMIADTLADTLPDAIFILCVRRPEGVVQSLERSYAAGFRWAGSTVESRARVYGDFYTNVAQLPRDRTILFDYDRFCADPLAELNRLLPQATSVLGLPPEGFDLRVLAQTHAPAAQSNPPIAMIAADGHVILRPRPSYDASAVTPDVLSVIQSAAKSGLVALREHYPQSVAASTL
jgi:Sulfotransferase family